VPIKKFDIDSAAKRYLLGAAGVISLFSAIVVAKWTVGNLFAAGAPDIEFADLAVGLAPSDPQSHFASAVLHEKTFESRDAETALREYETAASLSPNNYLVWLSLAKIRESNGDRDGAQSALARARDLAPNYARVRWAYGNLLLRQGDSDPAFAEMRAAASADASFAPPLVTAASQFYDGEPASLRKAAGNSPAVLASLSLAFANEKRFDEALEIWQSLDRDQSLGSAETGKTVLNKMLEAKRYRAALSLANLLEESPKYAIGTVYNGSFENGVTMQNAGPFDWRIPEGQQPQAALTDGQRRGGAYSLLLIFRPAAGSELRPIGQTVAVVPGASYRLEAFYRSDAKTSAKIRWQVTAADGRRLAVTDAVAPSTEFTALACDFSVPTDVDGINITLVRDECTDPCPIAGNLWLDDISMRARQ
jgi:tetratricopeptide (TPR) repeat protein